MTASDIKKLEAATSVFKKLYDEANSKLKEHEKGLPDDIKKQWKKTEREAKEAFENLPKSFAEFNKHLKNI